MVAVGDVFGSVRVVEVITGRKVWHGQPRKVRVRCRCGQERDAYVSQLRRRPKARCSDDCPAYREEAATVQVGQRFGLLVALGPDPDRRRQWLFRCACSAVVSKRPRDVRRFQTPRCRMGCPAASLTIPTPLVTTRPKMPRSVHLVLDEATAEKLGALVEEGGGSRSEVVRRLIEQA